MAATISGPETDCMRALSLVPSIFLCFIRQFFAFLTVKYP